jgi:uncharacterized membrane protein
MKPNWKAELPLLLLLVGMFVLAAVTWSTAPERIPMHWGLRGEVDRYGGRVEGLLMLPALAVFVYLLMLFLPRIDPGRLNYERFAGAYYTIRASVMVVFAMIYGVIHLWIRGVQVDMPKFVGLLVGGMFFLFGNVLGKIRPNWFFGVRTPWTLSSKRAWTRTHRLAGWVFILGGIAVMAAGVLQTAAAVGVATGVLVVGLVAATVYSYLVWRTDPDRVPPAGTLPGDGED